MRPFKATSPLVVGLGGSGAASSLLTGLVAYWKLDEASGNRADSSGLGNTLTEFGGTTSAAAGKIGNCPDTLASSRRVDIPTNTNLQMGDIDFTISAWIFATTTSNQDCVVHDNGAIWDYDLGTTVAGKFYFYFDKAVGGSVTCTSTPGYTLSTWYFVVCIHDSVSDLAKISVNNGSFDTVAVSGGTKVTAGATFKIGNGVDKMDEVGIWKKVLSASEITTLYNSGAGLTYPF